MIKKEFKKHLIFQNSAQSEKFSSPSRGSNKKSPPNRNRESHGALLLSKLQELSPILANAVEQQREVGIDGYRLE